MPHPEIERLTPDSSADEKQEAISACIEQLWGEKKGDPDWTQVRAVAACHQMARDKMGQG